MKIYRTATLSLIIPAFFLLSGCLEEQVHTNISADGSSERVISMRLPSKQLPDQAFPIPSDSSWRVEWKETGENDSTSKYEYVARKMFQTPDDLHREYKSLPDTGAVGIDVSIDKTFEWFFTYINFREVYTYRNPFGNVPVSDYLTREEINLFQRDAKNDSLKRKVKRWSDRDEFEEFYRPLVTEAQRRNDGGVLSSLLRDKKEDCFDKIMALDSLHKVDSTVKQLDNLEDILRFLAKALDTDTILGLRPVAEQAFGTIARKESNVKHPDGWKYTVQMPGLILESNSDDLEGNTITWKFNPDQVKVGDYTMHAASRTTNIWAFVTTGIMVLFVALIFTRHGVRLHK